MKSHNTSGGVRRAHMRGVRSVPRCTWLYTQVAYSARATQHTGHIRTQDHRTTGHRTKAAAASATWDGAQSSSSSPRAPTSAMSATPRSTNGGASTATGAARTASSAMRFTSRSTASVTNRWHFDLRTAQHANTPSKPFR